MLIPLASHGLVVCTVATLLLVHHDVAATTTATSSSDPSCDALRDVCMSDDEECAECMEQPFYDTTVSETPRAITEFTDCMGDFSLEDYCIFIYAYPCCLDFFSPNDCLANDAFVAYHDCVAQTRAFAEDCPKLSSCGDVIVDNDQPVATPTIAPASTPTIAPASTSDGSITECTPVYEECKADAECYECITADDDSPYEWQECISTVDYSAFCTSSRHPACCFDQVSPNDCMANDLFVDYFICYYSIMVPNQDCDTLWCDDDSSDDGSSSSDGGSVATLPPAPSTYAPNYLPPPNTPAPTLPPDATLSPNTADVCTDTCVQIETTSIYIGAYYDARCEGRSDSELPGCDLHSAVDPNCRVCITNLAGFEDFFEGVEVDWPLCPCCVLEALGLEAPSECADEAETPSPTPNGEEEPPTATPTFTPTFENRNGSDLDPSPSPAPSPPPSPSPVLSTAGTTAGPTMTELAGSGEGNDSEVFTPSPVVTDSEGDDSEVFTPSPVVPEIDINPAATATTQPTPVPTTVAPVVGTAGPTASNSRDLGITSSPAAGPSGDAGLLPGVTPAPADQSEEQAEGSSAEGRRVACPAVIAGGALVAGALSLVAAL